MERTISRGTSDEWPSVTIGIPVLNEEPHIEACLDAVLSQTYSNVVEVLVVDGGSTDRTRELAGSRLGVRVIDNPRRIQAAALNIALEEARGEVFVRVDGHCLIAKDYVERCVSAIKRTGAAVVGGPMRPAPDSSAAMGAAVAMAMASRLGAGTARFHRSSSPSGWADTVYLGAYHTDTARKTGGYSESVGVNEDAEFAYRMRDAGGIWLDQSIRSHYLPRQRSIPLARQFYRYGRSRAATVRAHPRSMGLRQLAPPLLIVGLLSPWRRRVLAAYSSLVCAKAGWVAANRPAPGAALTVVIPIMHLSWGVGFLAGLAGSR